MAYPPSITFGMKSIRMGLSSRAFWAKNALFRKRAMAIYSQALLNESKSSDELAEINWTKRRMIVTDAFENSSFYKTFYQKEGFAPADLKSPSDWQYVPVLEKDHIRRFREQILCRGTTPRDLIRTTTGGSTGLPLLSYRDARFPEEIIKWRMLRRWAIAPEVDKLMLWRIPGKSNTWYAQFLNAMIWWPTRRYKFDVSSITSACLSEMERVLLERKPGIVWGYVGALQELAEHLSSKGVTIDYSPLVWATASPMSRAQTELFRRVFGPNILDQYACSEIHWVASNVRDSRDLLVDFDYRHVDIVESESDGSEESGFGDLLLTDLENRAFPLIRYRNGDRSRWQTGRVPAADGFPRMSPVMGRISDSLKTLSGRKVPGEYLTTIFDEHHRLVARFSILQKKNYSVEVRVQPSELALSNRQELNEILEDVSGGLGQKLGEGAQVTYQIVDEIPHESGKFRFVKSELS